MEVIYGSHKGGTEIGVDVFRGVATDVENAFVM